MCAGLRCSLQKPMDRKWCGLPGSPDAREPGPLRHAVLPLGHQGAEVAFPGAAAAAASELTTELLQSCPTLRDPRDGSPPGSPPPPSLGFSRQEHWSGLPFPSPMRESEVAQSCLTLSDPMDCSLPGSTVHGIFQARVLEWGAIAWSSESQTPRTQGFSSLWNSLGSADLSNPIFQSRKYDHASFKMQPLAHGCPGKQDCLVKPKSEQGFPANICLPCASLV